MVFKKGDGEECPWCHQPAFVEGTYGTLEVPGRMYPPRYKLCLDCGYDEYDEEKPRRRRIKSKGSTK